MAKNILLLNQKGGVGKSMLSDEIAFEFDRLDIPYNFYDLDGQGGNCHEPTEHPKAKYSIIDTPGQLTDYFNDCIKEADVIIVPTRASTREIPPLNTTIEMIEKNKKKKAKIILVLNGWNNYTSYAQFEAWLNENYPELDKILRIPQSEALSQANSSGISIIEYKPRCNASEQLKKLLAIVEYELGMTI